MREYHIEIILTNGMLKIYGAITNQKIELMNPIEILEKLALPYKCHQILLLNVYRVK